MSRFLQASGGVRGGRADRHAAPVPEAKIQCRGNFQVTKYGLIATPYCEEEQIAFVARSYGSKVTAAQVHRRSSHQGLSLPDHRL